MRLAVMFVVALLFIDAALLGNIGSILGAVIDPANMVDNSSSNSNSTGTSGSNGTAPPTGASGGF